MSANSFYLYILLLTMGLMQSYSHFRHHFSGVEELKLRVSKLDQELKEERVKTLMALYEAESVRQEVATLLPDKINLKSTKYEVRRLASVLQAQESLPFDNAKVLLEKGKKHFDDNRFQDAILVFKTLIEKFPQSLHVIESYFLMSESYFQVQSVEDCIDSIDTMVTLFPESELTGFALLRLAMIFNERELVDDAKQVLLTVKHHFPQSRDLQEQSARLLKRLE